MEYLSEKLGESSNGFNEQFLSVGGLQEEERTNDYDVYGYKQEDLDSKNPNSEVGEIAQFLEQMPESDIEKAFGSINMPPTNGVPEQPFDENLPVDDFFLQNLSFTIPGAFKNDNMDLDESPPFTIELDVYYDTNFDGGELKHFSNVVGKQNFDTANMGSISRSNTNENFNRSRSNTGEAGNFSRSRSNTVGNNVARHRGGVAAGYTPNGRSPGLSPGNTNSLFVSRETPTQSDPSFSPFEALPRVPSFTNQQSLGSHYSSNNNSSNNLYTTYQGMNELRNGSIDNYYSNSKPINKQLSLGNENYNNMLNHNDIDSMNEDNNNFNNNVPNNSNFANIANANHLNASLYNELSPLTTTTSLTPSVGSVHSTQPSFFSAQQYLTRNSLDQPPSLLHRPSFDLYKSRQSIDSLSSQQHNSTGRYTSFTNSISNMLPFMNQRSIISGPPSPQQVSKAQYKAASIAKSPVQPQSRHLIRSIFKSSMNNEQFDPEEDYDEPDPDFMMMSPTKEEPEYEEVPLKKAKKTRRSLFTRFKTPVKTEGEDKEKEKEFEEAIPDSDSLDNSMTANASLPVSSCSRTPSGATNGGVSVGGGNNSGSLNGPIAENLAISSLNNSHNNLQEPDYAALFENVGKRKIVNTSSYRKSKTKVKTENDEKGSLLNLNLKGKVKTEPSEKRIGDKLNSSSERQSTRSSASTERSRFSSERYRFSNETSSNYSESFNDATDRNDEANEQNSDTGSNYSDSPISKSSHHDNEGSSNISAFSAASKRILGSKIPNKNQSPPSIPVATMISKGVEVEVDLKSLDLPADTKIFPTNVINSKNRTRGRKENKQADMVDLTKIYLCNYCSRRFKRQEHLKRHFRSLHTFEKPYDCLICHKKFSRSDNLNQHMKIHKEEEAAAESARNQGFSSRLDEDDEMEY